MGFVRICRRTAKSLSMAPEREDAVSYSYEN